MNEDIDIKTQVAYVKGDLSAMLAVIKKLEKPLTNANWASEAALLSRQSERCRKALLQFERALVPPKPARAASAGGGAVKGAKATQ